MNDKSKCSRSAQEKINYIENLQAKFSDELYQLIPQSAKKIPHHFLEESTIPRTSALSWLDVTPFDFELVEPVDSMSYALTLHSGSAIIDGGDFNSQFRGYADVYDALLAMYDDTRIATKIASLAWLQHYLLNYMVFVPQSESQDWNSYGKGLYLKKSPLLKPHLVKEYLLHAVFPDAIEVFDQLRLLDSTSLDGHTLIEQTCLYSAQEPVQSSVIDALPNDM